MNGHEIAKRLLDGDRAALARAITLVESRKPDHQEQASILLDAVIAKTGGSIRLGISGVPGVGKSTTIDQLGVNLIDMGHKLAVLAVDPSSTRTGGSILGDKTRMARLSLERSAFIRPSPSAGTLGGVAAKTREAMLLCEAAGFDVVIVETVGTGQSETVVSGMVDFFAVLMLPGGGDELQGIKKGIVEVADMIAINKADGPNQKKAEGSAAEYRSALHILTPASAVWSPPVITMSAVDNHGLDTFWEHVVDHREKTKQNGDFGRKRQKQSIEWVWAMVEDAIRMRLHGNDDMRGAIAHLEQQVANHALSPRDASNQILQRLGLIKHDTNTQ